MTASLQANCLLPVSEIVVTGTSGSLVAQGFLVPFLGNVLIATLTLPHGAGSCSGGGTVTAVEHVYGSGESSYHYQLSRFVEDVRRPRPKCLPLQPLWHTDESADCAANAAFIDAAYVAAGLTPRTPSLVEGS
ncbi:hypothetical protein FOA52_006025 [Chlamydomonas sp. UWO 241]|nr:hypothetical protein FOA52_006025 [Chlamydomonas sp. UWO 241]